MSDRWPTGPRFARLSYCPAQLFISAYQAINVPSELTRSSKQISRQAGRFATMDKTPGKL